MKLLSEDDASQVYVNWMNDEKITQFLESRDRRFTLEEIKKYVKEVNDSENNFLFGVFLKENCTHIGNIKIGNINQRHKFAEVGLIIGNRKIHSRGYGTEAISLVTQYAFGVLKLNKLVAGMYVNNIASYKAFIKAGYRGVGRFRNHRLYKGRYVDEILVEKCRDYSEEK